MGLVDAQHVSALGSTNDGKHTEQTDTDLSLRHPTVARALPSASKGMRPRDRLACLAGVSPLHVHVSELYGPVEISFEPSGGRHLAQ
jgi:hypothetical protein